MPAMGKKSPYVKGSFILRLMEWLKLALIQSDYLVHMGLTEYTAPVYRSKCFPGGFK